MPAGKLVADVPRVCDSGDSPPRNNIQADDMTHSSRVTKGHKEIPLIARHRQQFADLVGMRALQTARRTSPHPTIRPFERSFDNRRHPSVSSMRPNTSSTTARTIGSSVDYGPDQSPTPSAIPISTSSLPSPIGQLPAELLILIFSLALSGMGTSPSPEAYHRILLVLRLVCRHWANTISSHSAFHTKISLLAPMDLIAYKLQCIGQTPITVTCDGHGLLTEDKVRLALKASSLWSKVDLHHDRVSQLGEAVPRLLRGVELPSLDQLSIRIDHAETSLGWAAFLAVHRPPKLRALKYDGLHNIPAAVLSGAFKNLRALHVTSYNSPPPTTAQTANLLRENPLLEELDIVTLPPHWGNDVNPEDTSPIVMPRLHHLALRTQGGYPSNGLLEKLLLPKCSKVVAYVSAEYSSASRPSRPAPPSSSSPSSSLEPFDVRLVEALSQCPQVRVYSNAMLSISGDCQWTFETSGPSSRTEVSFTVADTPDQQAFASMVRTLEAAARPINISRLGGSLRLDSIHHLRHLPLLHSLSLDVREDSELWQGLMSSDPKFFPPLLEIPAVDIHYHINHATGPSAANALANAFQGCSPDANLGGRLRTKHVQLVGHWWLEDRGDEHIPAWLVTALQQSLRCDTVDIAFEAGDTRPEGWRE